MSEKINKKYINAVKTILFNADPDFFRENTMKLTAWLQWFKNGALAEPSALFFFSKSGATGKSMTVEALESVCEYTDWQVGYVSFKDLSSKFLPSIIKYIKLAVIKDADFF